MLNAFLSGLLATTLFINVHKAPAPSNYSFSEGLSQNTYTEYVVKDGDYLSGIAGKVYGREEYWTNIWNDNPQIQNAAKLEQGTVIRIRDQKTQFPELLSDALLHRMEDESSKEDSSVISNDNPVIQAEVVPTLPAATPAASIVKVTPPVVTAVNATDPHVLSDAQITYLGNCEAGMNPARNSGNGYYGAFQFSYGTWKSMGTGYERADLAPIDVQKAAVQRLVARSSIFTQFPGCSRKMRSAGVI